MPQPPVPADVLRSFYHHAPLMMGVVELVDGDVRHLTDNEATGAFFGVGPEALQGRLSGAEMGTPPEILGVWLEAYQASWKAGAPVRFVYSHPTPDGERWLSVVVAPVGEASEGARRCLYVAEDATARKQAQDGLRETSVRLGALVENFPGGVLVEDPEGQIVLVNDAFCDQAGLDVDPDALRGQRSADVLQNLGPVIANVPAFAARIGEILAAGEGVRDEVITLMDGRILERDFVPIASADGEILGRLWQYRDVTERTEAARRVAESEARYRLLAENVHDFVGLHGLDGTYQWVSPSSEAMLGYTSDDLVGTKPYDWFHPDDRERILSGAESPHRQRSGARTVRFRMRHRDGHYVWLETIRSMVTDESGEAVGFQSVSRDVTHQWEMEEALVREAHYDALTALPNRLLFRSHLQRRCAEAASGPFVLLFVDLDRFKVVNDTLGHTAGDALLREAAARIAETAGPDDTVGRFGGDEFAMLLDAPEAGHGAAIAEQILTALTRPFTVDGHVLHTSASVGLVEASGPEMDPDDLLRSADLAMYEAKRRGRDRWVAFDADMAAAAQRRLRLEVDLRGAGARGEFYLVYQPIVRLGDGHLVGFEALLRWNHPELGLISPGEFVPIAEESGQADELDAWVFDEGCRQMRAWQDAAGGPLPFTLSINASGGGLNRPLSADLMLKTVDRHGLAPDRVQLEITENVFIDDPDAVSQVLRQLRERGVRIALDDFGTGYSSLRLLHALPVDVVKIDRSFVGRMDDDPQAGALVEAVVRMSDVLGKSVVAEGIETPTQLSFLREVGSASGQGFLLARPLSVEQATEAALEDKASWASYWARTAAA
ncbi:MAG: EAL domain-containing protein [Bacteroidota bacterium]